jgi:hypothetical protein
VSLVSVVHCLCIGLITCPVESSEYGVPNWVWSWSLNNEEVLAHYRLLCHKKKCNWIILKWASFLLHCVSCTSVYCLHFAIKAGRRRGAKAHKENIYQSGNDTQKLHQQINSEVFYFMNLETKITFSSQWTI